MPTPLAPLSVVAPGFYGLNKQQSAGVLPPGWATETNNAVIDSSGRVAARKGYSAVTTTPLGSTPNVEQIHEYINASGVTEIISAANSNLYSGTTTLTSKTGSLTITDDNWKFVNSNGSCIGTQASHEPIHYDGAGNFTLLHDEIASWQATTAYSLGDVVKSTAGNTTIYFHCTTAGTSGGSEPTWDTTVGNTTADNTATWTTRQFPQGGECLGALGRLWITDSNNTTIYYSDLLIPYKFSGGSSGLIDMTSVWTHGMDSIVALAEFNGHLLIFGKRSIVVYTGAADPDTMSVVEQIQGIGCAAQHSVQDIGGTDIWWLSTTGVRSFARTIQEKSMPMRDISKNVRDYLNDYVTSETVNLIRSVYHAKEGFYLLNLPTNGVTFCFDTRAALEDGSAKVTTWSGINPRAFCSALSGDLYMGHAGIISKYNTYLDNTSTYILSYKSTWNDFGQEVASLVKIPKRMKYLFLGGAGYTITSTMGFDFAEDAYTQAKTIPAGAVSEWNIFEWGVGQWSGSTSFKEVKFNPARHGFAIQYGFNVVVNGQAISLQRIDLLAKIGRLA